MFAISILDELFLLFLKYYFCHLIDYFCYLLSKRSKKKKLSDDDDHMNYQFLSTLLRDSVYTSLAVDNHCTSDGHTQLIVFLSSAERRAALEHPVE